MGRDKSERKRIENSSNRQVTYRKRSNGILKKAKEISVLCDAQVSLLIYAPCGKMLQYSSPSTTLVDHLDEYQKRSGNTLWDAKHEDLTNEVDRVEKENDNMQIQLRHLQGADISSLRHPELMAMEETLENGLTRVRNAGDKMVMDTHERLSYSLRQYEMEIEDNVRKLENGYHQRAAGNYYPQIPFPLRVQPIQPNLQDKI